MESADFVIFVFALGISLSVAALAVALNLLAAVDALLYGVLGAFALAAVGVALRRLLG